jgi:hypothetical protein
MNEKPESLPDGTPYVPRELIREIDASFYSIAVELGVVAAKPGIDLDARPASAPTVDDAIQRIIETDAREREIKEFGWFGPVQQNTDHNE